MWLDIFAYYIFIFAYYICLYWNVLSTYVYNIHIDVYVYAHVYLLYIAK